MRHCRSVSSTDVLWVHQLVLPPQAFGSSVRPGNVRVSLFFLQFLCSIGEPFLRADLAPQGRRTEPRSRLAKASAGGGMVLTAVSTAPDWWFGTKIALRSVARRRCAA